VPETSDADIVRAAFAATNRGDAESVLRYTHPDVDFVSLFSEAEGGGRYHGHDGIRSWMTWTWETVSHLEVVAEQVEELPGHRVLVRAHQTARGRSSGLEMSWPYFAAGRLEDGRFRWWGAYRDEAEARAALERDAPWA
jgi:ketosteroid isomerase-like protein